MTVEQEQKYEQQAQQEQQQDAKCSVLQCFEAGWFACQCTAVSCYSCYSC